MNILVIGGGGREHAIIQKLKENRTVKNVYAMPGNGGIARDAVCLEGSTVDSAAALRHIKERRIDFVVVSPDDPLVAGVADRIREAGIPAFGPSKAAARIEGSKVFSKGLMKKYDIPTAGYEVFDDPDAALFYIKARGVFPVVIKADGLALGTGVIIAETPDDARAAVDLIMREKKFGASGNRIVVEEFLRGHEVTVLAFTDSVSIVPMVASMDHKRAFDGDRGPNTGGMGVIAPNPFYTPAIAALCMETIFAPTIKAMNNEGCPFKGCLYFGLMLTDSGPKVIEYNCRFGDPEAQAVLPLLKTDLLSIMTAVEDGSLSKVKVEFDVRASCCVVLASKGYPGAYEKGIPVTGLDTIGSDVFVCHAGTAIKDGAYVTGGGRVLSVTALGRDLPAAIKRAYSQAGKVQCPALYCRRDIGAAALKG
jgi:phosphoribosylamine--glycine ligase